LALYDKRIGASIEGQDLGEEFTGYVRVSVHTLRTESLSSPACTRSSFGYLQVFRITGGNDKQGFPMKQGVLTNLRVRLLLAKGLSCYRPRRTGERKRKSVRGCIVGPDLSVLNLIVDMRGDQPIPGVTDQEIPKRLGPKRASKLRKWLNRDKGEDIRDGVVTRTFEKKGKIIRKRPKIQRLITPVTLHRKRRMQKEKIDSLEKSKRESAEYSRLVAQRIKEQKEARRSEISKRRSSRKASAKADKTA
jgi:ribosomal protein S6E (S10)